MSQKEPLIADFKLERYFAKYEFAVKHLLCCSDCESMPIGKLLDFEPEARKSMDEVWLGYTESTGSPDLKRAIVSACYPSSGFGVDNVLVHSGAQEAILTFAAGALRPGDHVIIHSPCYQSAETLPRSFGCEVTLWRGVAEQGWALDLDELEAMCKPNTKAIMYNCPNNPTGWCMTPVQQEQLIQFARQRKLILFSDEVYFGLERSDEVLCAPICEKYELGISLNVMSKAFGLAGLRVGWVASPNTALLSQMAAVKDYTTICTSAPSEFLSTLALRHSTKIVARTRSIIEKNLLLLNDFFARHGDVFVGWKAPLAGPIAFVRIAEGVREKFRIPVVFGALADDFCDYIVKSCGVLLLPGSVYDITEPYVRVGYGRESLATVLQALDAFLSSPITK